MAKQHSDHIENRFREAAENISFPENPEAWRRMESLLDQEKKRRPIVFWWYLLFCLIIGVAGFLTYHGLHKANKLSEAVIPNADKGNLNRPYSSQSSNQPSTDLKKSSIVSPLAGKETNSSSKDDAKGKGLPQTAITVDATDKNESRSSKRDTKQSVAVPEKQVNGKQGVVTQPSASIRIHGSRIKSKPEAFAGPNAKGTRPGIKKDREKRLPNAVAKGGPDFPSNKEADPVKQSETVAKKDDGFSLIAQEKQQQDAALDKTKNDASDKVTQFDSSKQENNKAETQPKSSAVPLNNKVKIDAKGKKWLLDRGFNFSFVTQLDATALHHFSLHEFKPLYGGAIGYRFSNRLTVQTGLNVQRAIYFAGADDYSVKPGSYLSMYLITKIDANCLLYEVPISLRYDAVLGNNFRIYGNAGLSSYFLKSESYRYHLTNRNGTGYKMLDSTFHTNKSLFSSTYISLGFEKKITPSLSIQAEPYIKLPNSGIGQGKIKLYSSGLQLALKFQPVKNNIRRKK